MSAQPFHQRLAELWVTNKRRPLTPAEMTEVQHCLAANVKYCWELAYRENMALLASMTNDVDWLHEECAEIDRIQQPRRRKPRPKKASRQDT